MTANDPSTPAAPVVDGDPKDAEIRALANHLHRIIDEEDCPDEHVTAAHVAELIVNVDNALDRAERGETSLCAEVQRLTRERDALSEMLRGMARRAVACRQGYEAVASAYTAITAEDDRTSPPMEPSACGCGHPWHQIEADLLTARRDVAVASRPAIPADAVDLLVHAAESCPPGPDHAERLTWGFRRFFTEWGLDVPVPPVGSDTTATVLDDGIGELMCRDCGHPENPFSSDTSWMCDRHRPVSSGGDTDTTGGA